MTGQPIKFWESKKCCVNWTMSKKIEFMLNPFEIQLDVNYHWHI